MCGIFAYIGNNEALSILLDGLRALEYRGYDSAGLAIINSNHQINLVKRVGDVQNLANTCSLFPLEGKIGIAHCRWATHGQPSDRNSHPFLSNNKKIAVVHNGVIENFEEIKDLLLHDGYTFDSDTDSEILCNLVQWIQEKSHERISFVKAVDEALQKVQGTFGVCFIDQDKPDTLVCARHGVPVMIGVRGDGYCVASDNQCLQSSCSKTIVLGDNDIAVIHPNKYVIKQVSDLEGESLSPTVIPRIQSLASLSMSLDNFSNFMLKEITQEPGTLRRMVNVRLTKSIHFGGIEDYMSEILQSQRLMLIGTGPARYAVQIGQYFFEEIAGITCRVEPASEMIFKMNTLKSKRDILVAVSPSGENAECLKCVREAKAKNILALGIVNVVGSPVSQETDAGIFLHAGKECSVPCTKVFSSTILALLLFALKIAQENNNINIDEYNNYSNEIRKLPDYAQKILDKSDEIEKMTQIFTYAKDFFLIANGYNYPVALNASLLLKQTSYIHSEAVLTGEVRCGIVTLFERCCPVVMIAIKNCRYYQRLLVTFEELISREAEVIIITNEGNKDFNGKAQNIIYIPNVSECLTPILTIIPLQLISYYIGKYKKCPIDHPRNMAKCDG